MLLVPKVSAVALHLRQVWASQGKTRTSVVKNTSRGNKFHPSSKNNRGLMVNNKYLVLKRILELIKA